MNSRKEIIFTQDQQKEIASKSSISSTTIADYERGVRELRVSTLEKLINTFEKMLELNLKMIR